MAEQIKYFGQGWKGLRNFGTFFWCVTEDINKILKNSTSVDYCATDPNNHPPYLTIYIAAPLL